MHSKGIILPWVHEVIGPGAVLLWPFFSTMFNQANAAQTMPPPPIEWERSFGGTGIESPTLIQPTHDGGWIVGGVTSSPVGGNKTSPTFGNTDVWLVRLNGSGDKLWDATFGGTNRDHFGSTQPNINLQALLPASDGGFVFGTSSSSGASGNKASPNHGVSDYWLVRVDSNGNKVWDQSFGGGSADYLQNVLMTGDGGFLLAGRSYSSTSGNKTSTNFGFGDYWVVRVDANGQKLWEQSFGGAGDDVLTTALSTDDQGFLLAGSYGLVRLDATGHKLWHRALESTNFGTVVAVQPYLDGGFILGGSYYYSITSNRYDTDYSIMRVDANGRKVWSHSFGGNDEDALKSILKQANGNVLLGGYSYSGLERTKSSPNFGENDYWLVCLDEAGNKLWDQSFGSSSYDKLYYLVPTVDGGTLLVGNSGSATNGNKTSPGFGITDIWLVRLDANGTKLWEQTFGGTGYDGFASVRTAPDGGAIFCAQSDSPGTNGNKFSTNWGSLDFWVMKLGADDLSIPPKFHPVDQTYDDIRANGYRLSFTGSSNLIYRIEFTEDFITWRPLQTNQAARAGVCILDPGSVQAPQRFYRAVWLE